MTRSKVTAGQQRILDYLLANDRLSTDDHEAVGIRGDVETLKVQICYLRNAGYDIRTEFEDGTPRRGGSKKCFYRLAGAPFEAEHAAMARSMGLGESL